jgi:hypothetical protein
LKSRFIELEQDALKVETASSKIKYVPKRFVVCLSRLKSFIFRGIQDIDKETFSGFLF